MALSIPDLLDYILENLRFFHPDDAIDGRVAIPHLLDKGASESRLVLVLGENAGGKSFFRRLIREATSHKSRRKETKPFRVREMIHLSMEGRAGTHPMPVVQQMIYGGEEWLSTGDLSADLVTKGIKTASSRDHEVLLYWDEPDVGMSFGCAAGAGLAIKDFIEELPEHIQAVFVTTHSPHLVLALTVGLEHKPHYLYLGNDNGPPTLKLWANQQFGRVTAVRPEELKKKATARFEDIRTLLKG